MNYFKCYLCGNDFKKVGESCMHTNEEEEESVSICDDCADKAMKEAKEEGVKSLSDNFFNCSN